MILDVVNPMFDVAFRYLIDDDACAKLLLGEIIEKEILECELLNNEIVSNKGKKNHHTILKLDFKAKIRTLAVARFQTSDLYSRGFQPKKSY